MTVGEAKNVYDHLVEIGQCCPGCAARVGGFWVTIKDPAGSYVVSTDWILTCPNGCGWSEDITDLDLYL